MALMALLLLASIGTVVAFWASGILVNVTDDGNNYINVGEAPEVNTTLAITGSDEVGDLVPINVELEAGQINYAIIPITFTWTQNGNGDATGTRGNFILTGSLELDPHDDAETTFFATDNAAFLAAIEAAGDLLNYAFLPTTATLPTLTHANPTAWTDFINGTPEVAEILWTEDDYELPGYDSSLHGEVRVPAVPAVDGAAVNSIDLILGDATYYTVTLNLIVWISPTSVEDIDSIRVLSQGVITLSLTITRGAVAPDNDNETIVIAPTP